MITPREADQLAQETIQNYVNACRCGSTQDIGNALMKLASMCGLAMCATVGHREAVERLQGTTDYIAETQAGKTYRMEVVPPGSPH